MSEGSISQWLGQLKAGDPSVAQPLWDRYFERLVDLARKKLHANRQAIADEEDVALSAFASFCRGAAGGRFPQLHDRTDLWRLLIVPAKAKGTARVARRRGSAATNSTSASVGLPRPVNNA